MISAQLKSLNCEFNTCVSLEESLRLSRSIAQPKARYRFGDELTMSASQTRTSDDVLDSQRQLFAVEQRN